ncbi:MAG: hypothetical protein ACP5PN_06940 [Steroidobacteraceae bacterium]
MITLTFKAFGSDSMTFVRGTYFRICADGTLRGPDNAIAASYSEGLWQVARQRHRAFECRAAIYLRVTGSDGQRRSIGPYAGLRVSGGELYANDTYLGAHGPITSGAAQADIWREIALLSEE